MEYSSLAFAVPTLYICVPLNQLNLAGTDLSIHVCIYVRILSITCCYIAMCMGSSHLFISY